MGASEALWRAIPGRGITPELISFPLPQKLIKCPSLPHE
jgi:hypothetical protein